MNMKFDSNTMILIVAFVLIEIQLLYFKFGKKINKAIRHAMIIILNRVFCIIPLDKKRVLFISDVRESIGNGNLGYLYNYIPEEYKKITSFKADRRIKRNVKESMNLIYNISVSKYILLDDFCRTTSYIKVRKRQELVQLWHGPGAFKRFGHSRKESDLSKSVIHPGYKRYTKAIVSSEDIRWCYAEAFSINVDKVKATGFPRTDMFFNEQIKKGKILEYKDKYPFLKNKKVILFAPTYRGTNVKDAGYDFTQLNLEKIYQEFKDDYVFLFKWHPALYNNLLNGKTKNIDITKYPNFYYDLSAERDINDLLLVADVLITDYSSVIFDWAFLNKPIIYFIYDLYEYENGRGLYFPFNDYVYGEVVVNSDELVSSIKCGNLCKKERKIFNDKFLSACDGKSTEKTYKWIFEGKL